MLISIDQSIYNHTAIDLPKPVFFVAYNGEAPLETQSLSLSKNIGDNNFLQVSANIININYKELEDNNAYIVKDDLYGYSYIVERVRYYKNVEKSTLEESIDQAIKDTKEKGLLPAYIDKEVFKTMLARQLTFEDHMEASFDEGKSEGKIEGKIEGILDLLISKFGPPSNELLAKLTKALSETDDIGVLALPLISCDTWEEVNKLIIPNG